MGLSTMRCIWHLHVAHHSRPVPQRAYRKCVEWNEGMCVEYDKTRR